MKFKPVFLFLGLVIFLISVVVSIGATSIQSYQENRADPLTYLPLIMNPPATETPTPPDEPEWLDYLNGVREDSGLLRLTEEADWSNGGMLHGRYMVKNNVITHTEDPANAWYSVEGAEAADHGNIYVSASSTATFDQAIDWWLRAPFHAVSMLDPELQRTGFGIYHETAVSINGLDWQMGATIDVERGRDGLPDDTTYPIYYPAHNGTTSFTQFAGSEYPNPLSSCSGFTDPVGLPLIIQVGAGSRTINVTDSRLQQDGEDVDHCLIDETNYVSNDSFEQSAGRIILDLRDAIVIVPRNPLQDGSVYTVEVSNDGTTYSWQFTVVDNQRSVAVGFGGTQQK